MPSTRHDRRTTLLAAGSFLVAGLLLIGPGRFALARYEARQRAALARFDAPLPEQRKHAAWDQLPTISPAVEQRLVDGLLGKESDPDVRAAYAYTLARGGCRTAMPALEQALDSDPDPLVRCEAWDAIAQLDAAHARRLLDAAGPPADDWDTLGRARAELATGRTASIPALLDLAGHGTHAQRVIAGRVVTRAVLPLLDAVGRRPIDFAMPEGGTPWSAAQIERIRAVGDGLDYAAIRNFVDRDPAAVATCRANLARIHSARGWLGRRLFGGS